MAKEDKGMEGQGQLDFKSSMILNLRRNIQIFQDKIQLCNQLIDMVEADDDKLIQGFSEAMAKLQQQG